MIADIENEIKYFKKKLIIAINIFFALKKKYERDDDTVVSQIVDFKNYLKQFHEKYAGVSIILDEEDLTPDDLKIFLLNYNKKEDIMLKYGINECPLFVKKNVKYNKLQVLLDYKTVNINLSQDLEFLGMIAIETSDPSKKIIESNDLKLIGNMDNKYHGKDAVFTTGNMF